MLSQSKLALEGAERQQASQIPPQQWEHHRSLIESLYGSLRLTNLMLRMEQDHGFSATKEQYKTQFKRWNLTRKHKLADDSSKIVQDYPRKKDLHNDADSSYSKRIRHSLDSSGAAYSARLYLTPPDHRQQLNTRSQEGTRRQQSTRKQQSARYHQSTKSQQGHEIRRIPETQWSNEIQWIPETQESEKSQESTGTQESSDSGYGSISSNSFVYDSTTKWVRKTPMTTLQSNSILADAQVRSNDTTNLPTDRGSKAKFHTPSVNEVIQSCSIDSLLLSNASSASSKTTRAGSFAGTSEESEGGSERNSCWPSGGSTASSDMDFSSDAYRNALDSFLVWIDKDYMPQLVPRFHDRHHTLLSESSIKSHTTRDSSQGSLATPSDSTANSSQVTSSGKKKRKFTSPNGPAEQEIQNDKQVPESPVTQKKRKMKLACHFHKRDPSKFSHGRYKTCPYGFDGLHRLKDHQGYVHRPAYYCKRCKRIFKTQDLRDAHNDQEVRCERREDPSFEDYLTSDKQRAALAKKKPVGVKDEDHWFEMWDGYFPDEERPESPFQDFDPMLVAFRSFAEQEVLPTIQAYNTSYPDHGLAVEELTEFWRFAIDYAVANFAGQQRSPSSSISTPAPFQSQQQQQGNTDNLQLTQSYSSVVDPAWLELDPAWFNFTGSEQSLARGQGGN